MPIRDGGPPRSIDSLAKRWLDVVISTTGLMVVSPVLLMAALAIYLEDRGPVFFRQERAGVGGKPFTLIKLRSMRVNRLSVDEVGQVHGDHPLVMRTGGWLRRLKIDELPQLWNVLRGEMTAVGPRPTVPEQVCRYDSFQWRRLAVRPGLTGWAQVNGNTRLTWDERMALDIWYVDNWSLRLDAVILFRTLVVILFGERPNHDRVEEAKRHAISIRRIGS